MRQSIMHRKHWASADDEDDTPLKRQRMSVQRTPNHPVVKKERPEPIKSSEINNALEMEKVVEKRASLFT